MKLAEVPFVKNPSDKCVPATTGMVLAYFMSEKKFAMSELEELCGYVPGRGTWPAKSLLELHKMGFKVHWIEDFDHGHSLKTLSDICLPFWIKKRWNTS